MTHKTTGNIALRKKIVLTGGGTAGHVTPNMALMPALERLGWEISYIGSSGGMEADIIQEINIPFYGISSGKLRRYFDWQNFIDPFKILKGVVDAYGILRHLQPHVIFSKGGFVTVPVIVGAWLNRIPIIIHESDFSPGLANKIALPFAAAVCLTFPETLEYVKTGIVTGLPIRSEILNGDRQRGYSFCGFNQELPILLVIGGSSGSTRINGAVRQILGDLTARFQIIHGCGKGNLDPSLDGIWGYRQVEYLGAELADVLAIADLVVCRAGANTIFELLALRKPHLLIPLPRTASRGDQILNATSFQRQGYSAVLLEEDLNASSLTAAIDQLNNHQQQYIDAMTGGGIEDIINRITQLIEQVAG